MNSYDPHTDNNDSTLEDVQVSLLFREPKSFLERCYMAAEIIVPSIIPMAEFARMLAEQALSAPADLAEALTPVSARCYVPSLYDCYPWT